LFTSYALSYAVIGLIAGSISDRLGKKTVLMAGIVIFSGATFWTGLAHSFSALIGLRILAGAGAAMIEPNIYSIVGEMIAYEQRGKIMGLVSAAFILPTIVGIPAAGLITDVFSWRITFIALGAAGLFMLIAAWRTIPVLPSAGSSSVINMIRHALSNRTVTLTLLISFMYYGGLEALFSIIGVYYDQRFALSPSTIGLILFVAGGASIAGSLVSGKAMSRPHNKKTMLLWVTAGSLISILLLTANDRFLYASIGLNIIWSFFYAFGQTIINTYMSNQDDRIRSTVMSLNSSAMYFGATIMSAAGLTLLHAFSFIAVGGLCAAAYLIASWLTHRLSVH